LPTVIGFGDSAANFDLVEKLVLDHQSPSRNIVRYRNDASGRRENKLIRTIKDRSDVLVSYEGFDFDDESDRDCSILWSLWTDPEVRNRAGRPFETARPNAPRNKPFQLTK
jgi:hypothetical protein